ncbi:MAG: response regulator, partial [Planctomycetota bacterium]|nr:response regulator [Planctomycetota bacterium]
CACRHQVDAILMDLAMPEMDGFEAIAKLQENSVAAETTIIACSAFATSEWREKAMSAGCEGFITKPVEPEKLVSQVRKIVLNSKIKKFLCQQSS